jgi:hypothetical protein
MANQITFELTLKSADEIAEQISESQNAGALTALLGHKISKRLYNPDSLLETALMCVEGFNQNGNYKLVKSLDTEECNIKLGISPIQDKSKGYLATLEHDFAAPGTEGERNVWDAIYDSQNMLEKYFTITKRR